MNAGPVILVLVVALVLFFVLRELYCWYFKTNEILRQQEDQKIILDKILSALNLESPDSTVIISKPSPQIEEADTPNVVIEKSDEELMAEYNISLENEMYVFETYKYEKLKDAINYAKLQAGKSS